MAEKNLGTDEELPRNLLARLEKLELKQEGWQSKRNEFRFERNILVGAGLTHESEVEIVRELVGEKWDKVQTKNDSPD